MGETKGIGVAKGRRSEKVAEAWKALLLVVLLGSATVVGGCTGIVSASKPTDPGTGAIQLNPTTVNFGNISVGKQTSQTVTIANTGTASLNVTQATVSNSLFKVSGMTLPMAMSAGQSSTFTVSVTPAASGAINGTLTIQGDAGTSPAVVNLSANVVASTGNLQSDQSSLAFGSVTNGNNLTKQVVLTNTGTAAVQISAVSVTGTGFTVSGVSTPATVNASATATLSVKFAPTATGAVTGSLTVTSNSQGSPITISLSGTGTATPTGNLQSNQSSLSYGNVNTGTNSAKQVVLTNSGTAAVTISSVAATGAGVSVNGIATPTTLNPSATATLTVTFAPTAAGSVTGSVKVTSDAPGSPLTIPVSGTGVQPAISISPASFNFGNIVAGQNSSKSFTVTNTGSATLTISQLSISATGYSVNGLSAPSNVAPGTSVTFNAVFAPTAAGNLAGTVNIASNAPNSPATVALSGTGVAATRTLSFSASTLAFGNVNIGSTTATLSETITNTGNSSVQISSITVSGTGYSLSGASGVTLNPSQTFTFNAIFDPSTAGAASGSITVTSNASGSPGTITLSGTGVQAVSHTVSLTWSESGSSISGYNVYRSTTSGSGYVKVNGSLWPSMNYTDSAVQNGTTYFYVTTAVDGSGNESAFSNEASAAIPN
ncbi:MAG: choice-of-anchor D domain-containing protein [Acidobacteria bacterium]|nr:choice-of-anchor D domain-containing protein [Acidobacteriota bacterium]MBS1864957.1 choice-of-anchor D domain-containing protein [Acidobacteriota bacterium]